MMIENKHMLGLVIERRRSTHPWSVAIGQAYTWAPRTLFAVPPEVAPWTGLGGSQDTQQFYYGQVELAFYSTDTANYRDNLLSGAPKLWIAMRLVEREPPVEVSLVSADPTEGEAQTESGQLIVEALAMPPDIAGILAQFVADHHIERPIIKRKRDRATPDIRWRVEPNASERAEAVGRAGEEQQNG